MAKKHEENQEFQRLKVCIREKKLDRLYVFHGEETFLMHYYLAQVKKLLTDELTESFNYHKLTKENFDVRVFSDAVESLPMMAEHTLICVDDIDIYRLPEDERGKVCEVLSDIPDYCTVVFVYETVEWKPDGRLKKLAEAMSKASVVEFEKQDQRQLISWITRHFAAEKKQISPELCAYLIDISGGTMTALAGEISKIAAYSASDTIVKSDIDAVTEPVMDAVVFEMTDLMAAGKFGAALEKLQLLLKMQEEPIGILAAMGAHFRRLGVARTMLDNGKNAGDFMRLYGVRSSFAAQKTMDAARRFSAAFCAESTRLVMETDRKLKTSYDDPERLLELLILDISREARNA